MPFKRQKSNVSPHYHDTRTLLRKYRDVMWNLEVSDLDLQEEFKAEYGLSTDALFVDSEVNKGGNRLENYARALERSKKMMQIIDTAIDLMRRKHKKGEFYYWILYYAYVGIPGKDTTNHNGLDIAYPYGTPILAVEAGTVIKAGYHVSYGNYLVINHGGGYCTLYAHCSQLLAQVGDKVNKYDTIAKVGATGDVTGNHLHICVIIDGVYVNPKGYLH